jgi:hypothetical protein
MGSRPDLRGILRRWAAPAAAILLCTALLGWAQYSVGVLVDTDSYFHTRAARELDAHGFRRTFPQAAFSTWSERYADKDLLFHLFLIPFQRFALGGPQEGAPPGAEDLVGPGKQAAVALTLLFFAAFAIALHLVGARWIPFWILLYFLADAPLLYDFLLVRPGVLGEALFVLELALVVRGRWRSLVAVGFLHTLAHSSFPLLPAVAIAAAAAPLLRREPGPWRVPAAAVGAVAAGLVLNPYFPNDLHVARDQILGVARALWWPGAEIPAFLFGQELLPAATSDFLGSFPALLPAAAAVVALLALAEPRVSTAGLSLLLMAAVPLIAGFRSERFFGFFFPAVVLAGARLWTELLGDEGLRGLRRRSAATFSLVVGLGACCLLAGASDGSVLAVMGGIRDKKTAEELRPAVAFLRREASPDELVYHNFWWDFSVLYHYRPHGRYVVALDPVFFQRHDPARFRKSLEAYQGRTDDLYRVLKEDFGARWVFVPKVSHYAPFFDLVRRDERFRKAFEDDHAVIARIP